MRAKPCIPVPGVIGVCGTGAGVGTTHLCIAIANYLCSKFYSDTAYLEMNTSREIRTLAGKPEVGICFHHQRVAYYPDMTVAAAGKILAGHCRYFVLDFGCPNPHTLPAFLACDRKLVVGNASPWKRTQYLAYVTANFGAPDKRKEDQLYICNFIESQNDISLLSKALGARVIPMPYFPDPFHIASSYFGFFDEILKK